MLSEKAEKNEQTYELHQEGLTEIAYEKSEFEELEIAELDEYLDKYEQLEQEGYFKDLEEKWSEIEELYDWVREVFGEPGKEIESSKNSEMIHEVEHLNNDNEELTKENEMETSKICEEASELGNDNKKDIKHEKKLELEREQPEVLELYENYLEQLEEEIRSNYIKDSEKSEIDQGYENAETLHELEKENHKQEYTQLFKEKIYQEFLHEISENEDETISVNYGEEVNTEDYELIVELSQVDSSEQEISEEIDEEEKFECLIQEYKRQTGKNSIFAGEQTKGFSYWLEKQEKLDLEISEELTQENEEEWAQILKSWIEESNEENFKHEIKSELKKVFGCFNVFERMIKKFMKLYQKSQLEKLSDNELNSLTYITENLKEITPIQLKLILAIRAFKDYFNDQYNYNLWNKIIIKQVQSRFFRHISCLYQTSDFLLTDNDLAENRDNAWLKILKYVHLTLGSREELVSFYRKFLSIKENIFLEKKANHQFISTLELINLLINELEKVIPYNLLSKKNFGSPLILSDKTLSSLLGKGYKHIFKQRKYAKDPLYIIAFDLLLEWSIWLRARLGRSSYRSLELISTYMLNYRKNLPISRSNDMQLYLHHPHIHEDYFRQINTKEKAYFLGFFFADGTIIGKRRISLYLSANLKYIKSNQQLIFRFCKAIGLNPNYVDYVHRLTKDKKGIRYNHFIKISFSSETMAKDLYDLGFKGSKSLGTQWPTTDLGDILLDLVFLLGFYDGEADVGRTRITSASKKFLDQIKDKFNIPYNVNPHIHRKSYTLSLSAQLVNLMQLVYPHSLTLKRKKFRARNTDLVLKTILTKRLLQTLIKTIPEKEIAKLFNVESFRIHELLNKWKIIGDQHQESLK